MSDNVLVFAVLLLLLASSALGFQLQKRLNEEHKKRETGDSVRLVVSILVTFTALVLGLVTSNVIRSFDDFDARLRAYLGEVSEVDARLREYGPEMAPVRAKMRAYLASSIADTWRDEPPPSGVYPTFADPVGIERVPLGAMLVDVDVAIRRLEPADSFHQRLADMLEARMTDLLQRRRNVIESLHDSISWPLLTLMTAWLAIVFAIFGLTSPRNLVVYMTIGLCAFSFASAIFLILDYDGPLDGLIRVSSEPARIALQRLDAP
jgi:hypothetical protein